MKVIKYAVEIDLTSFFDNVNHDKIMAKVAAIIKDKQVLKLIREYLRTGIMKNGCHVFNKKGTPQGGPLSPLLSNILLDELDKELELRGHRFLRYADDINIHVKSMLAARRVIKRTRHYLSSKHNLQVNNQKSKVSLPRDVIFLG